MKFLSIGDIHGCSEWKKLGDIYNLLNGDNVTPDFDYYIFVGDYTDSYFNTNDEIFNNLYDIIKFKLKFPKNVILLLGNHDVFYMLDKPLSKDYKYGCTGNREEMHIDLHKLFNDYKDLFQIAFQYENYLWTHAGIHKGWYMKFEKEFNQMLIDVKEKYDIDYDYNTISDKLNISFIHKLDCLFDVGFIRGGFKNVGGPLWVDKYNTYKKPLVGYHQIVGHTHIDKIKTYNKINNTSVTYIDSLEDEKKGYILNV